MSHRRLILFLSDVEGNLTALRQTLKRVCEAVELPTPEVKWVETPPEGLVEAGWHAAELELPPAPGRKARKSEQPFLEEQLDAMTQALAQDFRDRARQATAAGRFGLSHPSRALASGCPR